jgi:hypothetical protein
MVFYGYLTGDPQGPAGRYIEIPEERLHALLRAFLPEVDVDEDWYRMVNPDVDEAIRAGRMSSCREHYISAGYFEDRFPHAIVVDEKWYLAEYPDVQEAISNGVFFSAQHHFGVSGFKEGRLPYPGWTLQRPRSGAVRKAA